MTVFAISSVRFAMIIQLICAGYGLDWIDVSAQIRAESSFNPKAVSPVGAVGLMQVMPDTAKWLLGIPEEALFEPEVNVRVGCYYMAYLKRWWAKRKVEDYRFALAAYNCGPGRVLRVWSGEGYEDIEGRLPAETRIYVRRVLRWAKVWKAADNFRMDFDGSLIGGP